MAKKDWSSLVSDARQKLHKGPLCGVARMLTNDIPASERTSVEKVLNDVTIQASSLARALEARIGASAPKRHVISAHRRGDCTCGKEES